MSSILKRPAAAINRKKTKASISKPNPDPPSLGGLDYPFDEEEGGDGGANTKTKSDGAPRKKAIGGQSDVTDITCNINNGKYKIECKKDASEVYIPFNFIHKYFEIYGKLEEPKEGEEQTFTWLHSFAKIYRPNLPYNPKGIFTYFENYNVEVRDRVKCISGAEGIQTTINAILFMSC